MCDWKMTLEGQCPDPHSAKTDPHILLDKVVEDLTKQGQKVIVTTFAAEDRTGQ